MLPPASGRLRINGTVVARPSPRRVQQLGVGRIHRHTQGLVRALEEELQSLGGLEQVTPPSRGSIYSFQPKALSPAELAKALKALNRPVELSLRRGLVRLSPHIYNTEEDVAQAAQAVGRLLP